MQLNLLSIRKISNECCAYNKPAYSNHCQQVSEKIKSIILSYFLRDIPVFKSLCFACVGLRKHCWKNFCFYFFSFCFIFYSNIWSLKDAWQDISMAKRKKILLRNTFIHSNIPPTLSKLFVNYQIFSKIMSSFILPRARWQSALKKKNVTKKLALPDTFTYSMSFWLCVGVQLLVCFVQVVQKKMWKIGGVWSTYLKC